MSCFQECSTQRWRRAELFVGWLYGRFNLQLYLGTATQMVQWQTELELLFLTSSKHLCVCYGGGDFNYLYSHSFFRLVTKNKTSMFGTWKKHSPKITTHYYNLAIHINNSITASFESSKIDSFVQHRDQSARLSGLF